MECSRAHSPRRRDWTALVSTRQTRGPLGVRGAGHDVERQTGTAAKDRDLLYT